MKTVKILSFVVFSSLVLFSCKNSEKNNPESKVSQDLAINHSIDEASTGDNYLYVNASTGLSLREFANLQSNKLAVMPYGTKVKVIASEKNATMTIGGIKGGMNEIEFNQKKGFAFNGYLSKYFPPEKDVTAKGYISELKEAFPTVSFSETIGGTASKPINTETVLLPNSQWHEAFYMAQKIYEFPSEFIFPNPKGKDNQVIKDSKPKKEVWVSELQVERKDNQLSKIEYVYKTTKGFSKLVSLTKEGDTMKIVKTEKVE